MSPDYNKSYFHANHQGSIVAMSNASGNVTEMHSYDSYGNSGSLTGTPFRYTGRRLDAETGLYYYRARYYSPAIGRFLQTDPTGYGDGLNWYAYVQNDPINKIDPTGNAGFGAYALGTKKVDPNSTGAKIGRVMWTVLFSVVTVPVSAELGAGYLATRLGATSVLGRSIIVNSTIGGVVSGGVVAGTGGNSTEVAIATSIGLLTGMKVGATGSIPLKALFGAEGGSLTLGLTAAVNGGKPPSSWEWAKTILLSAISSHPKAPLTVSTGATTTDAAVSNVFKPSNKKKSENDNQTIDVKRNTCEGTRIKNLGTGSIC